MIKDRISRSSRSDVHPANDHFKVFIARASRQQKWTLQRIHIEFLPEFHQFVDENMFLCLWSYVKDDHALLFSIWDMIVTSLIEREENMRELHCFFMCRVLIDKGHISRTRRLIQNRRLTQFSWNTKRHHFNSACIQVSQVHHATHEIRPNKLLTCGFWSIWGRGSIIVKLTTIHFHETTRMINSKILNDPHSFNPKVTFRRISDEVRRLLIIQKACHKYNLCHLSSIHWSCISMTDMTQSEIFSA